MQKQASLNQEVNTPFVLKYQKRSFSLIYVHSDTV